MGLANACVPHDQLDAEVQKWAEEICERSPAAIAIAKRSFNMDTAHQAGIASLMYALKLYYDTDESREGVAALKEKRKPDFLKYFKQLRTIWRPNWPASGCGPVGSIEEIQRESVFRRRPDGGEPVRPPICPGHHCPRLS